VPGAGTKVLGDTGRVLALDSTGLVVPGSERTVVVLGLEDVVVVDTGDALLVTDRAHAQDVKAVVEALKESGRSALT
jgi:mannose-1-phosphate guanylyltransferase